MQYVRELLDSKTPPLLESSTNPPTPLVACLLDMLIRPLQLVSLTSDHTIRYLNFTKFGCYSLIILLAFILKKSPYETCRFHTCLYIFCRVMVLKGLSESILCPDLSEPIKLFILPALSVMPNFPFAALTETLCYDLKAVVPFSSVLLFSFLTLDPTNTSKCVRIDVHHLF